LFLPVAVAIAFERICFLALRRLYFFYEYRTKKCLVSVRSKFL